MPLLGKDEVGPEAYAGLRPPKTHPVNIQADRVHELALRGTPDDGVLVVYRRHLVVPQRYTQLGLEGWAVLCEFLGEGFVRR